MSSPSFIHFSYNNAKMSSPSSILFYIALTMIKFLYKPATKMNNSSRRRNQHRTRSRSPQYVSHRRGNRNHRESPEVIEPDLRLHDELLRQEQELRRQEERLRQEQLRQQGRHLDQGQLMRIMVERMEAMQRRMETLEQQRVNGNHHPDQNHLNQNPVEDNRLVEQLRQEQERVTRLQNELLQSRMENTIGIRNRSRVKLRINSFDAVKSSAHTWMEQFERACETKEVQSATEKIDLLRENLLENAMNWFESRLINHAPEDWQDWKESFLRNFMPSTLETIRKAVNFKFLSGWYTDYFYEKEKRILKIFPADARTVMLLIIEGLPDDVAREILKNQPENPQAVLNQLKSYSYESDHTRTMYRNIEKWCHFNYNWVKQGKK